MLLEAANYRPNTETIYEMDADLETLTTQIRELSPYLRDALDAGTVTITKRVPTKSVLAAAIIETTELILPGPEAAYVLGQVRKTFGVCELDFASARMAIPLESYEPSAFKKQITHTVSELPE